MNDARTPEQLEFATWLTEQTQDDDWHVTAMWKGWKARSAEIASLREEIALQKFFTPDRNAVIEECIAAIDSVDYDFDDPLEAATTKIRALKVPPKPERAK